MATPDRETEPRLLTLPQVAQYLQLSTWTVRELIWRGELPRVKISRKILVDRRDLEQYIESRKDALDRSYGSALECWPPMSLPRKTRKGGTR